MNYLGYSKNTLNWLQTVLFERFGHQVQLSLNTSGALEFRLLEERGMITFDSLLPVFFSVGSDLPCCDWNPETEQFSSILSKSLPWLLHDQYLSLFQIKTCN